MPATETLNPYELANMADCSNPDSQESPGARFLLSVQDDYRERVEDGYYDEDDSPHEIADGAVPVYTHNLWQTFTDLGAYNEDPSELGVESDDMTSAAGVCLYMIAARSPIKLGASLCASGNPWPALLPKISQPTPPSNSARPRRIAGSETSSQFRISKLACAAVSSVGYPEAT